MNELTTPFWVACADCDPLNDVELTGIQEYDAWIREHREATGHRNQISATSRETMNRRQAPYRRLIEGVQ